MCNINHSIKKKNFQILFSNPSEIHAELEFLDIPYIFCKEATEYPSTNDLRNYFLYPITKVYFFKVIIAL